MTKVISVRFKPNGKSYYFSPGALDLQAGDAVIVETARGAECGEVVKGPHEVPDSRIVKPLKTVTRVADALDVRRMQQNRADEQRVRHARHRFQRLHDARIRHLVRPLYHLAAFRAARGLHDDGVARLQLQRAGAEIIAFPVRLEPNADHLCHIWFLSAPLLSGK